MPYSTVDDALILLPTSKDRPVAVRVVPAPGDSGGFLLQTRSKMDLSWVTECVHEGAEAAELHAVTYHKRDVHPLIQKQIDASLEEAVRRHDAELYAYVRFPDEAPTTDAFEDGWAPANEVRALLENHQAEDGPVDVEITIHQEGIIVDLKGVPQRGDDVGPDEPEVIGSRAIEWADLVTSI